MVILFIIIYLFHRVMTAEQAGPGLEVHRSWWIHYAALCLIKPRNRQIKKSKDKVNTCCAAASLFSHVIGWAQSISGCHWLPVSSVKTSRNQTVDRTCLLRDVILRYIVLLQALVWFFVYIWLHLLWHIMVMKHDQKHQVWTWFRTCVKTWTCPGSDLCPSDLKTRKIKINHQIWVTYWPESGIWATCACSEEQSLRNSC